MNHLKQLAIAGITFALFTACNNGDQKPAADNTTGETKQTINVPAFNEDSAYAYVGEQVALGPRVPGTNAQARCAKWMETMLRKVCDTVYKQEVTVTAGNNAKLPCINLVGSINPGATRRILLLTHWDSRPWADQDRKDADKPVLAADDGASGVGVLLEMARILKISKLSPSLGIDILFTDVEDYGKTEWGDNSYCLGTQYWAHHPHVAGYKAEFGILLDMVGARGAQFPMEGFSSELAGDIQHKIWQAAGNAGYSSYFIYVPAVQITDDHVPVNKITGIKTVDIINLSMNMENPFAPHWHTHADAMDIIDKSTLKAVGQTLLQTIYEHAATGATAAL